jgi:hypothetical protein
MLGRSLDHKEVVHHVNGDKLDNRPENLEILASQSDHAKEHYESGEFLPRNSRAQKICSVPGCGRKHRSLGLCLNHYMAKRRGKNKPVSKLVEEAKELLALYEPEALK